MEDVVSLTMLPMYGERNTMCLLLEEDDEEKFAISDLYHEGL